MSTFPRTISLKYLCTVIWNHAGKSLWKLTFLARRDDNGKENVFWNSGSLETPWAKPLRLNSLVEGKQEAYYLHFIFKLQGNYGYKLTFPPSILDVFSAFHKNLYLPIHSLNILIHQVWACLWSKKTPHVWLKSGSPMWGDLEIVHPLVHVGKITHVNSKMTCSSN